MNQVTVETSQGPIAVDATSRCGKCGLVNVRSQDGHSFEGFFANRIEQQEANRVGFLATCAARGPKGGAAALCEDLSNGFDDGLGLFRVA